MEDVYTVAYPYLKEKNIPFTCFVVVNFLDTPGYLTTEQLQEMAACPGVTIASHGMTHEVFPSLSREQKRYELAQSQARLEKLVGKPIELFAYSHGQFDRETLREIKSVYRYGFSATSMPINLFSRHRYKIPRVNIKEETYERTKEMLSSFVR